MAQAQNLHLILTFASLAALERSTDHLADVRSAARRSQKLLVLVKLAQPAFSSSSAPDEPTPAAGTSSHSSPASARSASHSSVRTAVSRFGQIQNALSRIYSAATKEFLAQDLPLAKVEVVVEELRGLSFCIPGGVEVQRVRVEDQDDNGEIETDASESGRVDLYDVAALGGTFDHLHAGHRILLSMAAFVVAEGGTLIVGVSDASLLKNKKHKLKLEQLDVRINAVKSFLELVRPTITHDVVPIEDIYGPTATDKSIQALVVSDETVAGAEAINNLRKERKLGELDVLVINLVAHDGGDHNSAEAGEVSAAAKMGSTAIRAWLVARAEEGSGQV